MLFKKSTPESLASEITPEALYINRRAFIKAAGLLTAAAVLAACAPQTAQTAPVPTDAASQTPGLKDELGNPANSFDDITNYNNFYEFSLDKGEVAKRVDKFNPSPWQVEVSGLVEKPKSYSLDELMSKFSPEERIYRLRCVEGWSMVIPWTGFSLSKLLKEVQPTSAAQYVRFTSAELPDAMPNLNDSSFPWPYTEGLRMDEAMHDLTLLATGLYGKPLPKQDGAPIRLVVPWKYGFKSAKSLVKIELLAEQPATFWNTIAPNEYGFYSNVNPDVPHPRWSQSTERRIGENGRRKTLPFNGYADQVGSLYNGMDLKKNY